LKVQPVDHTNAKLEKSLELMSQGGSSQEKRLQLEIKPL